MLRIITWLPITLFVAGLITIDVGLFFWSTIIGLIFAGLSAIFMGLIFGQAIKQLKGEQ